MRTTEKKSKEIVIERDISWMYFNHRILQESQRENVPLLERVCYLGIYSNNLDEFFRVRMATLNHIAATKEKALKKESKKSYHTINEINHLNNLYAKEYANAIKKTRDLLSAQGIHIITDTQVESEQKKFIIDLFHEKFEGFALPIWLSCVDKLTDETDNAIYLAIEMEENKKGENKKKKNYALMKLPDKETNRFIRLPDKNGQCYLIYLDDVIRYCMPIIFAGTNYCEFKSYAFKFTKDAEMEIDSDLSISKMQKVQKGVKSRKQGVPLRIVYDKEMPRALLKKVMSKFQLTRTDTILSGGRYHNHKDLMNFPDCGRKDLKFDKWTPVIPSIFQNDKSIFESIREKDRLLHVPYQSFDAYLRFLREAAINTSVRSIKITLYRLAKDSKVVETLIAAAKNKKKVTVVIELLARFDEVSNITWSKKMQDAGIKVIFGIDGLKVHSKLTLIERKEGNIACIGTGNFHEGNAKTYTDCMLFTAYKPIIKDVENVFNFINTPFHPTRFKELLVSPNEMRKTIVELIKNEIRNKRIGKPAFIKIKINHITDLEIIKYLYQASKASIQIDIVLRGNCSICTESEDLGGNIRIHGIIDRYLEHSRVLIFGNGGDTKYYIGSADWMPRNLDNRIEVMTPVYDVDLQKELSFIVDAGIKDTMQGRIVDGSGENKLWPALDNKFYRSQEKLHEHYIESK